MSLNDLTADELARIDSVCLAFESEVREGKNPSIDSLVSEFGGDYAELLRQELLAIQAELTEAVRPKPIREPFAPVLAPAPPAEETVGTPDELDSPNLQSEIDEPVASDTADDVEGFVVPEQSAGFDSSESEVKESESRNEEAVDSELSPAVADDSGEDSSAIDESEFGEPTAMESQSTEPIVVESDSVESFQGDPESVREESDESNRTEFDVAEISAETTQKTDFKEDLQREFDDDPGEEQAAQATQIDDADGKLDKEGGPAGDDSELNLRPLPDKLPSADEVSVPDRRQSAARGSSDDVSVRLPREGEMIGPYQIGDTIGKGGMGVVYAATDTRLNRLVAMKVLAVVGEKRAELTERFEREARAIAALSHPNIVELFDVGVENGLPYAVMEYLDGESLVERLERGPLSVSETRRLGAQICDALDAAHRGGVIHRDLKPHNVMLIRRSGGYDSDTSLDLSLPSGMTDDGVGTSANESTIVKLLDFGLSRVPRDGFADPSGDQSSETTREGVILGTPGFMAPEQARGDSVTSAADVFSLGCILFEAFYGRPAISGDTVADRFAATLEGAPEPDPIRRRDDILLADLIDECLRKSPKDRPESAADLAARLRRTETPANPVIQRVEQGYATGELMRRHFLTATAGGLVGAVVGGLAAPNHSWELQDIRRLAVLTFVDTSGETEAPEHGKYVDSVRDKDLRRGDRLAALLVNELSRIRSVAVTPYRPMVANNPTEFMRLGEQLEVDGFVSGSFWTERRGDAEFANLNLNIVSARTGAQLWGKTIVFEAGDNLLEQTKLAEDIAAAIGHGLMSSVSQTRQPDIESFGCLVDGKLYADPDSVAGLEKALMCLKKARAIDTSYADPHAAIALASITLAAQSEPKKAIELIGMARQEIAYLEKLRGGMLESIDARLANAMLAWQTLQRYEQAEKDIKELAGIAPNHWQVQHQLGLLQLTLGRQQLGRNALKVAKLLYPMSAIIKMDYARADWFAGNVEWAKSDARLVLNRVECPFAKGLLIDIHEQFLDYDNAAAVDNKFVKPSTPISRSQYFEQRRTRLAEQPYGPFGPLLNEAILDVRMKGRLTEFELNALAENQPPMLPLLLAAHPAFSATQLLGRARDMLPKSLISNTL